MLYRFAPILIVCYTAAACSSLDTSASSSPAADPQSAASPEVPTPSIADSLDSYLRASVQEGYSGVVLVAHGDDVLLHRAYSQDPAITSANAFWIGSLTKPVAAMSILKLREQGKLSVADPISKHISGVPADKRHISIHHLLTHTSGLGHRYASEGIVDRDRAIQTILELPIENPPGEYAYSSDGYSLLAALVSLISGQSYEQFLREQILRPAGMEGCGFWGTSPAPGEAVVAPVRSVPKPAVAQPNWGYRGAAGLRCTAEDLYRLQQSILGESLLSRFSKDVMFAPHVLRSSADAYGYGWQVLQTSRGTRLFTHTGGESGLDHYSSLGYYADEDLVVVFLSNAPEEITWDTLRGLVQTLFRQLR